MFKENPIFGVGIDSYGLYFKEYREAQYPLKYGFTLTSSNAHNTFLQFFSTAGFIVGMSYIVFIITVLYTALHFVNRIHKSNNFIFYLSILGAWIAFQAQSIISIDNIGISIWNWVLSGILLGISMEPSMDKYKENNLRNSNYKQSFSAVISWIMFIPAFVLVSLLYRGENESIKLRDNINYEGMNLQESIQFQANKVNSIFLIDPYYRFLTVNPLMTAGFEAEGLQILTNSHLSNPRNADYLESLARFYENKQSFDQAIKYREKIHKLDPWNAENILLLGLNYKSSNKIQEMELCLDKILSFASQDQIGIRAKNELRI
jgi:tetratricopeptide (TPR) repeat protein